MVAEPLRPIRNLAFLMLLALASMACLAGCRHTVRRAAPAIGDVAAPGRIGRIAMEGTGGDNGWDLRVALVAEARPSGAPGVGGSRRHTESAGGPARTPISASAASRLLTRRGEPAASWSTHASEPRSR
jgi:hypothetical protein